MNPFVEYPPVGKPGQRIVAGTLKQILIFEPPAQALGKYLQGMIDQIDFRAGELMPFFEDEKNPGVVGRFKNPLIGVPAVLHRIGPVERHLLFDQLFGKGYGFTSLRSMPRAEQVALVAIAVVIADKLMAHERHQPD
ncbi:MAG: hypothetical protein ACD_75C02465G0002 [uncultured bacterium]|nr:MAG: hypothetical protein ACD_75C02465G0002 [uncultured bacterium]